MSFRKGFYGQEFVLPELMDEKEVDAQFPVEHSRHDVPTFMPIAVLRTKAPEIAAELEVLWGYPGFNLYIESLTATGSERRGPPLQPEVLNALLALDQYHAENVNGTLGSIFVRVPDPTRTVRLGKLE